MSCRSFKAEIFFSLPINGLVIGLVCASAFTQEWVTGSLSYTSLAENGTTNAEEESTFNFGLFTGQKTVWFASSVKYSELRIACSEGRCLYSCGPNGELREADVEDALSGCPYDNIEGDLFFCEEKEVEKSEECSYPNSMELMHSSMWILTIMFIIIGLIFTVVCAIFGVMNAFSNPINTLFSVYGLVLWNGIAALVYFFPLMFYGIEFSSTINAAAPISQVVRGGDSVQFDSAQDTHLGYSYWLILIALFLHLVNMGLALWYIFGVIRKKQKVVQINYQTGPDNDILF